MTARVFPSAKMTEALVVLYLARDAGKDLSEVAKEFPKGVEQLQELTRYLDTLKLPKLKSKTRNGRFIEALSNLSETSYWGPIKRRRERRKKRSV